MRIVGSLLIWSFFIVTPLSAEAQGTPLRSVAERGPDFRTETVPASLLAKPGRDPLTNGILIGAVIAAAAGGVFVNSLCRAFKYETVPPANCTATTFKVAGLFAVLGAATGAGVDALFERGPVAVWPSGTGLGVRVRF